MCCIFLIIFGTEVLFVINLYCDNVLCALIIVIAIDNCMHKTVYWKPNYEVLEIGVFSLCLCVAAGSRIIDCWAFKNAKKRKRKRKRIRIHSAKQTLKLQQGKEGKFSSAFYMFIWN